MNGGSELVKPSGRGWRESEKRGRREVVVCSMTKLKHCHKSSCGASQPVRFFLIWGGPLNTELQEVMVKITPQWKGKSDHQQPTTQKKQVLINDLACHNVY